MVDQHCGSTAELASLSCDEPDLVAALAAWEHELTASLLAGAARGATPANLARAVRTLIGGRGEAPLATPVNPRLRGFVAGVVGVPQHDTGELAEFTRDEKSRMVRAAWGALAAMQRRHTDGWALAARGQHPDQGGWLDEANLLWGLSRDAITAQQIREALPAPAVWPEPLRVRVAASDPHLNPLWARRRLLCDLVAQLWPTSFDMHAFRVVLVALTGASPEECTALTTDDVEFFPGGVRLVLTKRRAGRIQPRRFPDHGSAAAMSTPAAAGVEFVDRPRAEVGDVIRRLLEVTAPLRARRGDTPERLFVAATVNTRHHLEIEPWSLNHRSSKGQFGPWLEAVGVSVQGRPDIRRLRKSGKVEKALAFGGRVAEAADDHHEETFRGHYANGVTLRTLSAKVITTAQEHWFARAFEGPAVIAEADPAEAADDGNAPLPAALDAVRQQTLDMGTARCRDPYDSPFGPAGKLCAVAPLRCLECRNAWILPSHLPQLLLFAEHLEAVRRRSDPEVFAAVWGQSHVNLQAILSERSDHELDRARRTLEDGHTTLHLPIGARAEFDR